MARADRLSRLDAQRIDLEIAYRNALITALEETAAGRWGLFGHRPDKKAERHAAAPVDHLIETSAAIDRLRDQLGIEPFALHEAFLAARGPAKAHAVGEPKQAQAWLALLASDTEKTA